MTPSQLTNEQKIAYLAELMGWEEKHKGEWRSKTSHEFQEWTSVWNPLTNWNHWRQVEEKVMEDEKLFETYLAKLSPWLFASEVTAADRPTRAVALISAHQSLSPLPDAHQ